MLISPILSLIFMVLGSSFFVSFISIYFKVLKVAPFYLAITQSSFYFGLLISSLYAEKLISKVGHIRSLTATCGLLCASTLILAVIPIQSWFWFRLVAGACAGIFYVAVESWLLAEYEDHNKGKALSLYVIGVYLAQSLGQLFLSINEKGLELAIIISAIMTAMAVVPVSVGSSQGPVINAYVPASIFKFLKKGPLGVAGCFLTGMIMSSLYSFMPNYFKELSLDPGLYMCVMIAGGAILQWPLGKISDSYDRRKVLVGLCTGGMLMTLITLLNPSVQVLLILVFFLGGLYFTFYPVAMALGCDCVEAADMVKMTGVLLFAYGVGAVLGPLLTPMFTFLGHQYILIMVMSYAAILFLIGLYTINTRTKLNPNEQVDFTVIPRGPLLEELYNVNEAEKGHEEVALQDEQQ